MKDSFLNWLLGSLREGQAPRLIQNRLLDHLKKFEYRAILPRYLHLRRTVAELGVVEYLRVLEEIEEKLFHLIQAQRTPPSPEEQKRIRQYLTLVEKEYPEIRPTEDRDFQLYLQARSLEDRAKARMIYSRLLGKYPNEDIRANLLRFYRKGRSLFQVLYFEARMELGAKLERRIKAYIQALVSAFAGTGSQTLALMGSIRKAVQILPPSKDAALNLLERLLFYSQFLEWHSLEFSSIHNVLKAFYDETLFQQRRIDLITEEEKARKKTKVVQKIDLQKVSFSPEDLQMILVSPKIQGTTNLTLAYCRKYWLMVGDPIFENKVLLYSQKYRTWHYAVFQAIARGRALRHDDEVILMNVYNVISRNLPYDYDIRREYLMQVVWRRIKPQAVVKRPPLTESSRAEELREQARAETAPPKKNVGQDQSRTQPATAKDNGKVHQTHARPTSAPRGTGRHRRSASPRPSSPPASSQRRKKQAQTTTLAAEQPAPKSIMERILEIDQTEQKNLHLVFRRDLEPVIEEHVRALAAQQRIELRPYTVSLATISIKNFILQNMNNPRPDWKLSQERLEVQELGLLVEDIEPIVETCFQNLRQHTHAS